jgi:hypothetical protein
LPTFDIWMFNILQLFLAISNDPHNMLLTSAHYSPQKHLIYVTLNWRCALNVSGQIKHLNMKTMFFTKEHFSLYNWHHQYAAVMVVLDILWRWTISSMFVVKGTHTTSISSALQASQLYTECIGKIALWFDGILKAILSWRSEIYIKKKQSKYVGSLALLDCSNT